MKKSKMFEELKKQRKITIDRWEGNIKLPIKQINVDELRKQREITIDRWNFWIEQWK